MHTTLTCVTGRASRTHRPEKCDVRKLSGTGGTFHLPGFRLPGSGQTPQDCTVRRVRPFTHILEALLFLPGPTAEQGVQIMRASLGPHTVMSRSHRIHPQEPTTSKSFCIRLPPVSLENMQIRMGMKYVTRDEYCTPERRSKK